MIKKTYMHPIRNIFSVTPPKVLEFFFPHRTVLKIFKHPSAGEKNNVNLVFFPRQHSALNKGN